MGGAVGAPVALIAEKEADIPSLKTYAASLSSSSSTTTSIPSTPSSLKPSPLTKVPAATSSTAAATSSGGRVIASPLAKKLAKEKGIDLSQVTGTGPNGRVTASDVEAASKASTPATLPPGAKEAVPAPPQHIPLPGVIAATPMAREAAKKAKID